MRTERSSSDGIELSTVPGFNFTQRLILTVNLLARIGVAAVGIPFLLWTAYQGGWWLLLVWLGIALLALWEMMIGEGKRPPSATFSLLSIALIVAFIPVGKRLLWTSSVDSLSRTIDLFLYYVPLVVLIMIILSLFSLRWQGTPAERFQKMTRFFWAWCYVSMAVPMIVRLGEWEAVFPASNLRGGDILLLLFVTIWAGDSASMLLGNRFGRTPLAPSISPKKTVEGLIGGLIVAVVAGTIVVITRLEPMGAGMGILATVLIAVTGQLGDLVESIWKRSIGTKESSHLIPGHGGVLDRFDSLFFGAPALYTLLVILYQ